MINIFRRWRLRRAPGDLETPGLGFRVAPDVKASLNPDGVVLIHLGKGTVFSANRAGALIWKGAAERWSIEKLTRFISGEFNIEPETARRDTTEFLEQLETEELLVADEN